MLVESMEKIFKQMLFWKRVLRLSVNVMSLKNINELRGNFVYGIKLKFQGLVYVIYCYFFF